MLSGLQRVSAIVGILSSIGYLHVTLHDDLYYRQLTKPWPVVATILYAIGALLNSASGYNISILVALVFCLIGMQFMVVMISIFVSV
jgi:pheromone shutdown protein TraB